jgi:hypothetical protein
MHRGICNRAQEAPRTEKEEKYQLILDKGNSYCTTYPGEV